MKRKKKKKMPTRDLQCKPIPKGKRQLIQILCYCCSCFDVDVDFLTFLLQVRKIVSDPHFLSIRKKKRVRMRKERNLGHPKIRSTKKLGAKRFYWLLKFTSVFVFSKVGNPGAFLGCCLCKNWACFYFLGHSLRPVWF